MECRGAPHALAHWGEADERDRRDHCPDYFQTAAAVRVSGGWSIGGIAVLPDHPAEANLRGDESDPDHYEGDHELPVERRRVRRNGLRKPPLLADKENH